MGLAAPLRDDPRGAPPAGAGDVEWTELPRVDLPKMRGGVKAQVLAVSHEFELEAHDIGLDDRLGRREPPARGR
jgi:hypothetical protein